jgi:hypothetical protein
MSYSTVAMDRDDGRGIDAVAMCAGVPWLRIWVVLCAAPVRSRGNGALLVYPPGRVPTPPARKINREDPV